MSFIFFPIIIPHISTKAIWGINLFTMLNILLLLHIGILVHRPRVFLSKSMLLVYAYYIIFFLFRVSGYYDTENIWFGAYHFPIYLSILIYTYYISGKDYKGLALAVISALIFIVMTALINIIQLIRFPEAARGTMGWLAAIGLEDLQAFYGSIGIAGYGFTTGVSYLFPVLIGLFKYEKSYKKYLYLISIVLIAYSVYMSSIVAPILISFIGIFLAVNGKNKLKRSLIIVTVILLPLLAVPKVFIANIFFSASEMVSDKAVSLRLNDIGLSIEEGLNVDVPSNTIEYRAQRIPDNIKQFLENPIFGKGIEMDAHIFWLNMLAQFGLIGTIPLVFIFANQIKTNLRNFREDFKYYYLISMLLFILMGFIKAYSPSKMLHISFLVIPGLHYIRYLKS